MLKYTQIACLLEQKRPAIGERTFIIYIEVDHKLLPGYAMYSLWKGKKNWWLTKWNMKTVEEAIVSFVENETRGPRHRGDYRFRGTVPKNDFFPEEEIAFKILEHDPMALDVAKDILLKG
jgi:hypothetical protein